MTKYKINTLRDVAAIARALGDESRLRIVAALSHGELCACQVAALLALAPSTISKHLSVLAAAGLVHCEKMGRWRYFHLTEATQEPAARAALDWILAASFDTPQIADDRGKLEEILSVDPEVLCNAQNIRC